MAIRKMRHDGKKAILWIATLAIVVSGLFPPWLFVFDATGTSDRAGGHSEWSAGYWPIFKPPGTSNEMEFVLKDESGLRSSFHGFGGIKLDVARLLVEWFCIIAISSTAWGLMRLDKEQSAEEI